MRRAVRRNRGRYPGRVAAHPGGRAPCPPPPDRRSRRHARSETARHRPRTRGPGSRDTVGEERSPHRTPSDARASSTLQVPALPRSTSTPQRARQPMVAGSGDAIGAQPHVRIQQQPSARVSTRPATGAAVSAAQADVDIDRCGAHAADHATPLTAHAVDHVAPWGRGRGPRDTALGTGR